MRIFIKILITILLSEGNNILPSLTYRSCAFALNSESPIVFTPTCVIIGQNNNKKIKIMIITSHKLIQDAISYAQLAPPDANLTDDIHHAKSLLSQSHFAYYVFTTEIKITDPRLSFATIDTLEWMINRAINNHLLYSSDVKNSQFLIPHGFEQLRILQTCHCVLVEYCWKNLIPIWVKDASLARKHDGTLHYTTEQESVKDIDQLWKDSVACFEAAEEEYAKNFIESYTLHSWLAKTLSRPKSRYLIRKMVQYSVTRRKRITIRSGNEDFGADYLIKKDCLYKKAQTEKTFFKRYTPGEFSDISFYIPQQESYHNYIPEGLLLTNVDNQVKTFYSPVTHAFLHECLHIKAILKNVSRTNFPMHPATQEYWSSQEEWYSIRGSAICENVMNAEYGLPPRIAHYGVNLDELHQLVMKAKTINVDEFDANPDLQSK